MDPFATPADVAAWRSLTPAEQIAVATQLEFASEIIRAELPDIDTRIAAGTLSTALAKHVAVQMVLRHLANPDGIRTTTTEKAIDDYRKSVTETRDRAVSDGSIYLTETERKMLSKRGSSAFSITPSIEPTTCALAERAAINQASWR